MKPTNCSLNSNPYEAGREAFDKAHDYVSKDPARNCCNVSGSGVVTEWKANGKVKLEPSHDRNTTFVYTNALPLK